MGKPFLDINGPHDDGRARWCLHDSNPRINGQ